MERGGKSAKRSEKRETNTIKMRGPQKAIVRSQNGEAQGRVDWKRNGWPDARFEVTYAKCDLRNEQQREKREESREKKEERREKREERAENREARRHGVARGRCAREEIQKRPESVAFYLKP